MFKCDEHLCTLGIFNYEKLKIFLEGPEVVKP